MLDHLYMDEDLYTRLTGCDVFPYPEVKAFSDHAPLIALLET